MVAEALPGTPEPDPVSLVNAHGGSPFLLTGDHAGNRIPARLGTLGVAAADRVRHIAWDVGVAALGEGLSRLLDAAFVAQRYSRLVIDCNRDPASPEAIPLVSDGTPIAGNAAPTPHERTARLAAIHEPYHAAVAGEIAARRARGQPTILIALHSFTPSLGGVERPWEVGVLHWRGETRFAQRLLAELRRQPHLTVGDNQPYRMDATDYSIPRHAFASGLDYAEIEVRQDLIGELAGQARWSQLLGQCLAGAYQSSAHDDFRTKL